MWEGARIIFTWLGLVLLSALFNPPRCLVPTAFAASGAVPPGVIINEGTTPQGYPYLHGGIGSDERKILDEKGKNYSLKLAFAERHGSFVASVKLAIEGANQVGIVDITTNGPWFYIDLPPGSYEVKAIFEGKLKELKGLKVAKGERIQRTIVWDLGPDTDPVKIR